MTNDQCREALTFFDLGISVGFWFFFAILVFVVFLPIVLRTFERSTRHYSGVTLTELERRRKFLDYAIERKKKRLKV
jgi:hypothetical protein